LPHLDRNGVKIFYESVGSGPTLLLSHGYSASSHMWAAQKAAFAAFCRVVTWDVRGHGRSDSPGDPAAYSEALTIGDMAAILDAVGAERAAIAGLSLGGYLSLRFHVEHPARVTSLLLFDTGPGYRDAAAREGWNEMARGRARFFRRKGLDAIADEVAAHGDQHRSAEGLALAAEGILPQRDASVIESLPGITVPTLVLVGAEDQPFLKATDYMAAKIPGAEKVVLPGAGHVANIDAPEPFNEVVSGFLRRNGWP
jgi:pimeloyl-ACP methyl ester carboxylesterase